MKMYKYYIAYLLYTYTYILMPGAEIKKNISLGAVHTV